MDFRANARKEAISLLYAAQRHAGSFGGNDLLVAAEAARQLANEKGWSLIASDSSGERIVGTASTIGECSIVDTSRRQDGLEVLIIAGMIAGPYGVAETAARARSMGALTVHCFYIGGWSGDMPGCDTVHHLMDGAHWDNELGSNSADSSRTIQTARGLSATSR